MDLKEQIASGTMPDDEYLAGLFHRTTMLLGQEGMAQLRGKTVAVAGCGGVGGAAALTLARLGVGGFVLADPGIFDPPDGNRQWAASRATLGRNKAEVHAELLRNINPNVRLTVFPEGVTAGNLDEFLAPADLLIDCLDISVPVPLRQEVYRRAMAKGLYTVSAPIFGFGTLILFAEPGGMGMDELIAGFVRVASTESKLPAGFPEYFFVPHVDAVEREIHKHRVPTSAISVVLATGLVSSEIARIFLKEQYPGIEGPAVLPQVFAVDPLRRTFRVLHHAELFRDPGDAAAREATLASVHHDIVQVPRNKVAFDLLSDSWSDLPLSGGPQDPPAPDADLPALLRQLYGMPHVVPVSKGRFAEALLAPLVVKPGMSVAMVAPFPTTRFHIEAAGGRIVDVRGGDGAFAGNVDCTALLRLLESGAVGAIWLEPCNDALGGQPLSLANLREVHRLAAAAKVPVVLDATRIFENAALLRDREPELAQKPVQEIVLAMTALADACAASLTKDLRTPQGGLIAVRDEELFHHVRDRTALMVGDGLDAPARAVLAGSVRGALERGIDAEARVASVGALADALESVGAPVVRPLGGHAVFVNAAAALPDLKLEDNPDRALANALYVQSGVRVGPAFCSPDGQRWIRCPVPVGGNRAAAQALVTAMKAVLERRASVTPLERAQSVAGGVLGNFLSRFKPRGGHQ